MNCWNCKSELVWRENKSLKGNKPLCDRYLMQSNFTCPKCEAYIEFFHKK